MQSKRLLIPPSTRLKHVKCNSYRTAIIFVLLVCELMDRSFNSVDGIHALFLSDNG